VGSFHMRLVVRLRIFYSVSQEYFGYTFVFTSISSLLLYWFSSVVRLIVIHLLFFSNSPSQACASPPLHYPVLTLIYISRIPVASLSFVHHIVSHLPISKHQCIWSMLRWQKFAFIFFLYLSLGTWADQTEWKVDSAPLWWVVRSYGIWRYIST
jgi:hypothetical protein